jgi:hypothetical protein
VWFGRGVDKVSKFWEHTIIFRDQASYTADNKTGSNGKVVPVHEMNARWGE